MSKTGFDLIADGIDSNLDRLHKQLWEQRAAERHAEADSAEGNAGKQARQALRDHYADRFRLETSRIALLDQAAASYTAQHSKSAKPV
ncbi:hypothetical protein [uncultured Sphingomonas sp.]|uniref:hypothetical protein n=1 Tax=uncultured Sphingomonas sp. TaxID=158754 RepID=UPI0035CACD9B